MPDAIEQLEFVILNIYMRDDFAEVARIAQLLVRQPVEVERFTAHLVPFDTSRISGLEDVSEPVVRLAITATTNGVSDLEQARKALNRIVSVFKVVVTPDV